MAQRLPIQVLITMIGNFRVLKQPQQAVLIQIYAGEGIADRSLEVAFIEHKPLPLRILHVDFIILDNLRDFGSLADIEGKLLLIWRRLVACECLVTRAGDVNVNIGWRRCTRARRGSRGIGRLQAGI